MAADKGVAGDGAASVLPPPSVDDFDQLYRDHVEDARRLATILVGRDQAEELVAEAFARVLAQLRAGRGPTSNFRSYLHVTIRNAFRDSLRAPREAPVSDQPWLLDDAQPPVDELVEDLDADTAAHAFATLPESWQKVLWHVEVEGRKPGEVADLLGMRARAVSSLAHRAREGLRRAYLDQHVAGQAVVADCGWTRNRLSQYVRSDLSPRAEEKVAAHIEGCEGCLAAYLQVDRVNRKLAAYLFPVVLLGALPAAGKPILWLAGLTGAGAGAAGAPGGGAGSTPPPNVAVFAAAAAAAVAVAAGGVAFVVSTQDSTPTAADTGDPAPGAEAGDPPADVPPADPADEATEPAVAGNVVTEPAVVPADETPTPTEPTPTEPTPTEPEPSEPTPTEEGPVVVEAVAPSAAPITTCDTYGDLTLPRTTGVSYALTAGDGRQGSWTVAATARSGYVLRAGSPSTFSGDLGVHEACTRLVSVTMAEAGWGARGPWDITAVPEVNGGPARTLTATYAFDGSEPLLLTGVRGPGWACRAGDRTLLGELLDIVLDPADQDSAIVCTFSYRGTEPAPVTLRVASLHGGGRPTRPAGTVTLDSAGAAVGSLPFGR